MQDMGHVIEVALEMKNVKSESKKKRLLHLVVLTQKHKLMAYVLYVVKRLSILFILQEHIKTMEKRNEPHDLNFQIMKFTSNHHSFFIP